MASPKTELENFAQSIYRAIKNRKYDEIDGEDGQDYVDHVIDMTNQFLDELEYETDQEGMPVAWDFLRQVDYALGSAVAGTASVSTPESVDRMMTDQQRFVRVVQNGQTVSYWSVVPIADIANRKPNQNDDMCALVNGTLVFSREFNANEDGGSIVGDVSLTLTRMTRNNVKVLDIVKPRQLLLLGVAKNITLPDIVQGKLSPSFVQKYQNLLSNAIARGTVSSRSSTVQRQSFGHVRGVGV